MLWNRLEDKAPIATESGCWDGLKSSELLVCTFGGKYHIATMYEGFLDGSYFREFYDQNDYEIQNVKFWIEIDSL